MRDVWAKCRHTCKGNDKWYPRDERRAEVCAIQSDLMLKFSLSTHTSLNKPNACLLSLHTPSPPHPLVRWKHSSVISLLLQITWKLLIFSVLLLLFSRFFIIFSPSFFTVSFSSSASSSLLHSFPFFVPSFLPSLLRFVSRSLISLGSPTSPTLLPPRCRIVLRDAPWRARDCDVAAVVHHRKKKCRPAISSF